MLASLLINGIYQIVKSNINICFIAHAIEPCLLLFYNIELIPLQLKVAKIKHKKTYPKKHNWLNKEQVVLLLNQPNATKTGIRDRFIILFLFSTGVRLDEFRHIKLKDIITEEKYPYVMVTGKGNKKRIIPVSDESFMENYNYYCTLYHQHKNMEDYLFFTVNRDGRGMMSEDNVQRILKKYADMARKTDPAFPNVHPHMMRHSYGEEAPTLQ